jgi:hypothetical protein
VRILFDSPTYIHTYIHTFLLTIFLSYLYAYIFAYLLSFLLTYLLLTYVLNLLTHSLTHSLTAWTTVLLENLTDPHLVKKFPKFYGTRMFITAFTRARHEGGGYFSVNRNLQQNDTEWSIFFQQLLKYS